LTNSSLDIKISISFIYSEQFQRLNLTDAKYIFFRALTVRLHLLQTPLTWWIIYLFFDKTWWIIYYLY